MGVITFAHRGGMAHAPENTLEAFTKGLALGAKLGRYRKATRGPKKPRPPRTRFAEARHISTSRLLNGEQT